MSRINLEEDAPAQAISALQDEHTFVPSCCASDDCLQRGCKTYVASPMQCSILSKELSDCDSEIIVHGSGEKARALRVPLNLTNQQTLSLESYTCYSRVAGAEHHMVASWLRTKDHCSQL